MAPADVHGYALLPQDDLGQAGGAITIPRITGKDVQFTEEEEKSDEIKVQYDGGRRFDTSAPCLVIHPFNPFVQAWNLALVTLLILDVLVLPIEIAFAYAMNRKAMLVFNLTSTVLFSMDIVLQFFLQIPSPSGDFWIFNHWKITYAYLTGYFTIDILSVMPITEIHFLLTGSAPDATTSSVHIVYLMRVLRFLKLLRIVRLKRIARRYEYDMNLSYTQRSVAYSGVTIFLSLHFMSCIWSTMGNYQVGDDWESYVKREKFIDADAGSASDIHEGLDGSSPFSKYCISMYFSLYTLTGIGYGDIVPVTWSEYVFAIIMMLIGSMIWATIIGEIVSVIKNAHVDEHEFQETADHLITIGKDFNLPFPLQRRLKAYVAQQRTTAHRNFVHEKVISKMSSDLAIQLTQVLHGAWYEEIWWLKNVSRSVFMVDLTLAFDSMLYCPAEQVRDTDRLYVIVQGLCVHGSVILGKNKCFGVDFLLAQDHLRVNLATVALSYLHTIYLTREALQKTLERYPRERALVRRSYRSLCVMRGIVYIAKKVVAQEKREARLARGQDPDEEEPHRKFDFIDTMGMRMKGTSSYQPVVSVSQALETRVSAHETSDTVLDTAQHLQKLEGEMTARMDAVETKVNMAMEMISRFVERKTCGKQGSVYQSKVDSSKKSTNSLYQSRVDSRDYKP